MKLSANALFVARQKYLRRGDDGQVVETIEQWLERVARALSRAEKVGERSQWAKAFKEVMTNLEFLPGGRTLANAGTINNQLANCFVLPFEDNIEEIFESVKDAAILKKNGGGVGFSFSKIRPKGDSIAGTTGAACGPVALMKILDASSEILLQAGGRRSGNMVVLADNHPDILEFITCKETDNQLQQINYSLAVTNKFMKAVEKDVLWNLINPRTGQTVNQIQAQTIFEMAALHAHKNGDPGLIFLDRINKDNPTPQTGRLEAVNLCGEQPLLSYEACNLGSVNLVRFVKGDHKGRDYNYGSLNKKELRQENEVFNWKRLEEVVRMGVRLLDNVISVCRYPLPQVDRVVKSNRKIGLGVMGWADSLLKLGIAYDSEEALQLAEKVGKFIKEIGHDESKRLGKIRGSFPNFSGSFWQKNGYKSMRNATVTTIAPTGSISLVAGVSSGIEPVFALSFYKQVIGKERLIEINQTLMEKLRLIGGGKKDCQDERMTEIMRKTGTIKHLKQIPQELRRVFVTAMDISPDWHIKMQAAFQKYTDNAVSKTINLPVTATVADVRRAFMLAWRLGCKGITVYRDKSKRRQVLNLGDGGKSSDFSAAKCPECGGGLVIEEGCQKCYRCGYSGCEV